MRWKRKVYTIFESKLDKQRKRAHLEKKGDLKPHPQEKIRNVEEIDETGM